MAASRVVRRREQDEECAMRSCTSTQALSTPTFIVIGVSALMPRLAGNYDNVIEIVVSIAKETPGAAK